MVDGHWPFGLNSKLSSPIWSRSSSGIVGKSQIISVVRDTRAHEPRYMRCGGTGDGPKAQLAFPASRKLTPLIEMFVGRLKRAPAWLGSGLG